MNTLLLRTNIVLLSIISSSFITLVSCKKEENPANNNPVVNAHDPVNGVTLLAYELNDAGATTGTVRSGSFDENPKTGKIVIDTLKLDGGKSYSGKIVIKITTSASAETIDGTAEIDESKDEHQVFFELSTTLKDFVTITYTDRDSRGLPVGLQQKITTANASTSGSVTVSLSHFDNPNDKKGTNKSAETDIEVTIPVIISKK